MKDVIDLYDQVQEEDFEKAYPQYSSSLQKVKILYVSPFLNSTGFYRMLQPLLELNKTTTHCALVSSIKKWDFSTGYDSLIPQIDYRLISWADYIVLPTMFSNLRSSNEKEEISFIDEVKSINRHVKLVMDIDINYERLPESHPVYKKMNKKAHFLGGVVERNKQLLLNLSVMDMIISHSTSLLHYYSEKVTALNEEEKPVFCHVPNYISSFAYQHIIHRKRNTSEKVKIGVIGNYSSYGDILQLKDVFIELQKEFHQTIEIILFGWNGKIAEGDEPLQELEYTYVPSVNFVDYSRKGKNMRGYFSVLNDLQLDIGVLPMEDTTYNEQSKSLVKYLELSSLKIPVVASNLSPNNQVIKEGENGLLAQTKEEWKIQLKKLIQEKETREFLGKNAFAEVWKNHSYSYSGKVNELKNIFVKKD